MQSIERLPTRRSFTPKAILRQFASLVLGTVTLPLLIGVSPSFAQEGHEKTFDRPGDAILALYNAVKSDNSQGLAAIFGSSVNDIAHTGDDVADKKMAQDFIRRYDEMHRAVIEPDRSVTLYIGAENWPLPIPIVKNSSGSWYFDTETGKKEILERRVGANENNAIETMQALVGAQREFASETRDGDKTRHYALKFLSNDGQHNGLYWKGGDNEPPSPIGPQLVSAADDEGYHFRQDQAAPFRGYYYRILTKQGAAAKGGALNYIVDGKLARGFAFVAFPAEYRNSGVMTFIVDKTGVVYQKDLGAQTPQIASSMQEFNPDSTWEKAD
jgi:hypothetical protein